MDIGLNIQVTRSPGHQVTKCKRIALPFALVLVLVLVLVIVIARDEEQRDLARENDLLFVSWWFGWLNGGVG